jgi:tetratricopeptide (TPR) repeat protein
LDQAFRFASAIHSDPRDMGQAQQSTVLGYVEIGAVDEAAERADQVAGWRRGLAYAAVAAAFAKEGHEEAARDLVQRAEAYRATVEGWQNLRILAHVGQALAQLGDFEEAQRIGSELARNDRVYAGRSVATVATGHAVSGRFDEAMKHLEALDTEKDIDYTWWRTAGYVTVAQAGLPRENKIAALKAAEESAEGISGWKKAEALQSIAQELRLLGDERGAKATLKKAEEIVAREPRSLPMKAPLLSNLARSWAQLGTKRHAARLLDEANDLVPSAPVSDRPAVIANIASTYAALGEEARAGRTYERALEEAATLINSRPRALAVSSVCSSMGRNRVPLTDAIRARLESLYGGLGDPW